MCEEFECVYDDFGRCILDGEECDVICHYYGKCEKCGEQKFDEDRNQDCMNKDDRGNGMEIKIKYHTDIDKLGYIGKGKSNWIDLRAAEDVFIPVCGYKLISLGVSMDLPEGYEAHIVPRSSTFKNFGIIQTNGMGVIDNSYNGDNDIWHFPAFCLMGKEVVNGMAGTTIHKNDRICQFRIVERQPDFTFSEVGVLGNADRGGIGSTGTR